MCRHLGTMKVELFFCRWCFFCAPHRHPPPPRPRRAYLVPWSCTIGRQATLPWLSQMVDNCQRSINPSPYQANHGQSTGGGDSAGPRTPTTPAPPPPPPRGLRPTVSCQRCCPQASMGA